MKLPGFNGYLIGALACGLLARGHESWLYTVNFREVSCVRSHASVER